MHDPAITFTDLTLGYNSHPAVHHLSGMVPRGALMAVMGANGSGKSTLLKGVAGLLKPMAGAVRPGEGLRMAYLPQQSELDRTFPARVFDLVSLGLWPRRGLLGFIRTEDRAAVGAALEAVGLGGFERRGIDTLSGGQLQRALFARVILQDASLILLDEPFNAVDARTVGDLVALMRSWQEEGRTVVLVAHDIELVRAAVPQTLLLARRPVAWGPTAEVLTAANLAAARRFHEAWDEAAPWCEAPPGHAHDHGAGEAHRHVHGSAHPLSHPAGHADHRHDRDEAVPRRGAA